MLRALCKAGAACDHKSLLFQPTERVINGMFPYEGQIKDTSGY